MQSRTMNLSDSICFTLIGILICGKKNESLTFSKPICCALSGSVCAQVCICVVLCVLHWVFCVCMVIYVHLTISPDYVSVLVKSLPLKFM